MLQGWLPSSRARPGEMVNVPDAIMVTDDVSLSTWPELPVVIGTHSTCDDFDAAVIIHCRQYSFFYVRNFVCVFKEYFETLLEAVEIFGSVRFDITQF